MTKKSTKITIALLVALILIASVLFVFLFNTGIQITATDSQIYIGDRVQLRCFNTRLITAGNEIESYNLNITSGKDIATIDGDILTATAEGTITVTATNGKHSDSIEIEIKNPDTINDPYTNVDQEEFYENYQPATSSADAYFRTQHGLMSGDISEQDQEPTIAKNQPKQGDLFVRNTSVLYSMDGDTYYVFDSNGNIVNKVYRYGAYVTLEEVAAYLMAFGDVPPNYATGKYSSPVLSEWGIYLRLNHTEFSGNTEKYPYEPVLPDISGCGGDLQYYEIDIGTTGTDCDPNFIAKPYNDGKNITRGAARIVYTRYDENGDGMTDVNEKYLFYTYNHYNDFQEYLNYQYGWGEMFGNVTGGGELSSKVNYNPTDYVQTARANFNDSNVTLVYIPTASNFNVFA